ncbi:hypothetical protein ACQPYK_25170 [Streptosporangium sp. CA-135522]|uniref:hypothetical protein n=1 Tax=Streptosporangium sp. CA-135522 TaxID=3240072 RepID=UPI003D8D7C27
MAFQHATSLTGLHVSIVPRDDDLVKNLAEGRLGSHALVITDDNIETFAIFGNAADLDWFVRRIDRQAAETLRETSRPEAGYVLAAELDRGELLGPFATEDDHLAAADRLLMALDARDLHVVKRTQEARPAPPTVIPASRPVALDQLDPGIIVQRWTEQEEGSDHVDTKLPCCGRRMTFPADSDLEVDLVCQYDRVRYTLCLVEEYDGGLLACFAVEGRVTVARPRPAKRRVR